MASIDGARELASRSKSRYLVDAQPKPQAQKNPLLKQYTPLRRKALSLYSNIYTYASCSTTIASPFRLPFS